jgi:hypothetical protein
MNELDPILEHRRAGHPIKFHPSESTAAIYCRQCKSEILSGARDAVVEVFESSLQFPHGAAFPGSRARQ